MSMIRRGAATGNIDSYTGQDDGAIVCKACNRIIVSKENLEHDTLCPYCHNDINVVMSTVELLDENDSDIIAKPC